MATAFLSKTFLGTTVSALSLAFAVVANPAEAGPHHRHLKPTKVQAAKPKPGLRATPEPQYAAAINGETGKEIICINCHDKKAPASPTKLVTAIIVAREIKAGTMKWSDQLPLPAIPGPISEGAQSLQQKKGKQVPVGTKLSVKKHMQALGLFSAADSAEALRLKVCGSDPLCFQRKAAEVMEEAFADNPDGQKPHSSFATPDGMANINTYTTAYDLAMVARLIANHYPELIPFFSIRNPITIAGVELKGHDDILVDYQREHTALGVSYKYDAIEFGKTGVFHHPRKGQGPAAHSTYAGSAVWDKYRITFSLLGEPNKSVRDPNAMKLLNRAFDELAKANDPKSVATHMPMFIPHIGGRAETAPEEGDEEPVIPVTPAATPASEAAPTHP